MRNLAEGGRRPVAAAPPAAAAEVSVVTPAELGDAELSAWRAFQQQDPVLQTPFLCPEFASAAAGLRPGLRVAILRQGGRIIGFLPFERHRGGVGRPVCGGLSDAQAVVAEPGAAWDARALVRGAGLAALDLPFLRAAQRPFAPHHARPATSHVIDLTEGFDAYVRARREAGQDGGFTTSLPHEILARAQRVARKLGPLGFRMHDPDPRSLHQLIAWKRQQYRRTGVPDAFARPWTGALLERLHRTQAEHFAGVLSTLSVGGRIIAAHMGIRSARVLHYWFPAYDREFVKQLPGFILLMEMCRAAAEGGIRQVELGPWDEPYKLPLSNRAVPVAAAFVAAGPSVPAACRALRQATESAASRLPIGRFAAWPGKLFRRLDTLRLLR